MTQTKKHQRAADPTAVRATVYLPPDMHRDLTKALNEVRKANKQAQKSLLRGLDSITRRGAAPKLSRLTLSYLIVEICGVWLRNREANTKRSATRKAA